MIESALTIELHNPQQASAAIKGQLAPYCRPIFDAGRAVALVAMPVEDARSIKQNKFYWGPCLGEISKQARLNGGGFLPDGWHWYFKRRFLGYEFKAVRIPGNKRQSVIKTLRSTTGLSVRKMSKYLDQVQACAADEFGVQFSVRNWIEWCGLDVDPETGEIRQ